MAAPETPVVTQPSQKVSDVVNTYRPSKVFTHQTAQGDDVFVTSLDFDDAGEFLVAACDDDTLQLYNAKEGKHHKVLYSKKYGVHLAKFTHNPQSVVYASTKVDDSLRLLSLHDSSYIRYFSNNGHTDRVTSIAMSPDGDAFLSGSLDNTLRLWDLNSRNAQGVLEVVTPYLAAFDPSATVFAVASPSTSSVMLYDIRNYEKSPFVEFDLREMEQTYTPNSVGKYWTKLEFSNDGKSLVIGTDHTGHFVLDAFDGKLRSFLRRKAEPTQRKSPGSSQEHPLGQGDISLTPDGRYVMGFDGKERGGMAVWDTHQEPDESSGRKYLEPSSHLPFRKECPIVQCNPRYNMVATADKEVVFWLPGDGYSD